MRAQATPGGRRGSQPPRWRPTSRRPIAPRSTMPVSATRGHPPRARATPPRVRAGAPHPATRAPRHPVRRRWRPGQDRGARDSWPREFRRARAPGSGISTRFVDAVQPRSRRSSAPRSISIRRISSTKNGFPSARSRMRVRASSPTSSTCSSSSTSRRDSRRPSGCRLRAVALSVSSTPAWLLATSASGQYVIPSPYGRHRPFRRRTSRPSRSTSSARRRLFPTPA